MRRIALITVIGILALWTAGCGGGDDAADTPSPDPNAAAPQAAPQAPDAATDPAAGDAVADAPEGEVAVPPPPQGNLPPELIASTDPDQRLQQIQTERPDPFEGVTIEARVEPVDDGRGAVTTTQRNRLAPVPDLVGDGELAPIPDLVGNGRRTAEPVPPPPPQPSLARAVQVTGVVQIGTEPHALVQAPNEPHSRYVRVGDRLSNGAVLVKRIDMRGAEPVVVLEEVGVEVPLTVGSGVTPAATTGTETAALPIIPVN